MMLNFHSPQWVNVCQVPFLTPSNTTVSQSPVMLLMYYQFTLCYSDNTLHTALVLCPSSIPEKVGITKRV
jgi:hypothetical protein